MSGVGSTRLKLVLSQCCFIAGWYFLFHRLLDYPVTEAHYLCLGAATALILFALFRPGFAQHSLLLFLPIYGSTVLQLPHLEGKWMQEGLVAFLIVNGLCLWYYQSRAVNNTSSNLNEALQRIQKGNHSRQFPVYFSDELGLVGRELNRLLSHLREKEILSQFIAPEVWQEIQRDSESHRHKSRERDAYGVLFVWRATELETQQWILDQLTAVSRDFKGFLNRFENGRAELLFLPDTEGFEKNALLSLSRLRSQLNSIRNVKFVVLMNQYRLKMGVVFQSEGYRYRCHSATIDENFLKLEGKLLEEGGSQEGLFLVNSSVMQVAEQMFHFEESESEFLEISGEKDLSFHLKNLKSPRVEEKLVSIRVISSHQQFEGVDSLIELLDDVSPRVRIATTHALAHLVNDKTEDKIGQALLRSLEREWNHDNRASLVISLGDLKRKEFVSPLFSLLSDENDRVRANAVEAIGRCMERKTVLRYLEEMLTDSNNRARANAAMAIWLMGEKSGLEELVRMTEDEDPLISCSGLYGIGEAFTDENVRICQQFLSDPVQFYFKEHRMFHHAIELCMKKVFHSHPLVERNAILALQKIRTKSSSFTLESKYHQTDEPIVKQMVVEALLAAEEFAVVSELRLGERA